MGERQSARRNIKKGGIEMSVPTTFWRLRIESEAAFRDMIQTSSAVPPDTDFMLKVSRGHGICLASYDYGIGTGRIRAMGIVAGAENGRLRVSWRETAVIVVPNTQGQQYWSRPYFSFAKSVAQRYRLAEHFAALFPAGTTTHSTTARPPRDVQYRGSETGGYVYLIKSPYGYKIGKTKNMKQRTQLFGVKLPFPIEIVAYGWFDDYSRAEADFHNRFRDRRLDGEWFNLGAQDIAALRNELRT